MLNHPEYTFTRKYQGQVRGVVLDWSGTTAPPANEEASGKFLRWNNSITQGGTELRQRYSLSRPAGRFEPNVYGEFVTASQQALGKLESTITTVIER